MKKYSSSWKGSRKIRKQRKYRQKAPLHVKQKLAHSHLSKDLKLKHKKRSLAVRKGDKVRVMIGAFRKTEGKVESVDLKNNAVYVAGAEITKRDGSKKQIALNPSNLMIMELNLDDKERTKILERKEMATSHLKRMATPKTWHINRKNSKFITKPSPGPHGINSSVALGVLIKEILKYATTSREVKKILNSGSVKVDGVVRKDYRLPVGIFDTVEFSTGKHFRIILNKKGKLDVVETSKDESSSKPAKITGKTMLKGKLHLNFYDGKNRIADKNDYKVGDTVILSLPEQKIGKHFKLQKKSTIFLTSGKHVGETGKIEDIAGNKIIYKDHNGEMVETLKEYAFVIGEEKPLITLEKND